MRKATKKVMSNFIKSILLIATIFTLLGCSLFEPKRNRIKEVKLQRIPNEFLNTYWVLETLDNKEPDCKIVIGFLEKGQLVFKFKDENYEGDFMWYIFKNSIIEFHTRPLEKLAWTKDNCKINPSSFSLYIQGERKYKLENNYLVFESFDSKELKFTKL